MGCFVSILHTKEILSFSVSLQGSSFLGHLGDTSASPPIRKVIGIRSQTLHTTQITIQNHITAYHNKFAEMSKLPLNKQKRELDTLCHSNLIYHFHTVPQDRQYDGELVCVLILCISAPSHPDIASHLLGTDE